MRTLQAKGLASARVGASIARNGWIAGLLTLAAAGLTILMFGLSPVTTRIATLQMDGGAIGLYRVVGAGILAAPLLLGLRLRPPRGRSQWSLLLISACGGFVLFPVLFSIGTQRTSACHAGLILASTPLFTGFIAKGLERRLPRPQWMLGAGIALAGETALVMAGNLQDGPGSATSILGDGLVLTACLAIAASFVAGARLTESIGAWAATFWAITAAALALAPWALYDAAATQWASLSGSTWVALAQLVVGSGFVAWVAWFWALARGGIGRVAVLQFFQPIISVAFAAWLLSERLTVALLALAAIIVLGVVVARASEPGRAAGAGQATREPGAAEPDLAAARS